MNIKGNIELIQSKIHDAARITGRDESEIELIAVSKKVDVDRIKIARDCGVQSFGESYVQEMKNKIEQINKINWHFIGQLQSNKVKYIIREIHMLHSLDRLSLAKELERQLIKCDKKLKVLVQINISREEQKGGILPENTEKFLTDLKMFAKLDVCGLMCIPSAKNNTLEVAKDFAATKMLYNKMISAGFNMRYLSMGMSNDYEEAIKQGANLVRVGSAIFGMRT